MVQIVFCLAVPASLDLPWIAGRPRGLPGGVALHIAV